MIEIYTKLVGFTRFISYIFFYLVLVALFVFFFLLVQNLNGSHLSHATIQSLTLDRTVLDTNRVLLFIKSVNALDQESVGPELETDEGLTADWVVVEGVWSRFDKRYE